MDLTPFVPLISALVGVGAALGGVYLKARIDRIDKAAERTWTQSQKEADILRQKGEDLHYNLDKYCSLHACNFINFQYWLDKKIDGKMLSGMIEDDKKRILFDPTKIKFLIDAYFPDMSAQYNELHTEISRAATLSNKFNWAGSNIQTQRPAQNEIDEFNRQVSKVTGLRLSLTRNVAQAVGRIGRS